MEPSEAEVRGGADGPAVRRGSPTPSRPMSLGMEGPKISRSRRPIRGFPGRAARARARLTVGGEHQTPETCARRRGRKTRAVAVSTPLAAWPT